MRILGIDPGLRITGYACLEGQDAHDIPRIVEAGVLRLTCHQSRVPLDVDASAHSASSISARLHELDTDFRALLARLKPTAVAVESIFAHSKHPATAITMGHARGVLLLAIRSAGLPLVELKPNAVKKSLTGHGHAAKGQMQRAVQAVFNLEKPPEPPDVADAVAIALCASRRLCAGSDAGVVGAPVRRGRSRRTLPPGVDVVGAA